MTRLAQVPRTVNIGGPLVTTYPGLQYTLYCWRNPFDWRRIDARKVGEADGLERVGAKRREREGEAVHEFAAGARSLGVGRGVLQVLHHHELALV